MWLESVVLWAWFLCMNDALCPVNLSLKELPASPMHTFMPSAVVMVLGLRGKRVSIDSVAPDLGGLHRPG